MTLTEIRKLVNLARRCRRAATYGVRPMGPIRERMIPPDVRRPIPCICKKQKPQIYTLLNARYLDGHPVSRIKCSCSRVWKRIEYPRLLN
jgi:hypothetical protein